MKTINLCKICKREFKPPKRYKEKQTCSIKCFYKLLSIGKIGKLNPRFNNGRRQYRRITKDIKICQKCDGNHNLETHHKDGNVRNNDPKNLIKTCRRCHMLLDGRMNNLNFNKPNYDYYNDYYKGGGQ